MRRLHWARGRVDRRPFHAQGIDGGLNWARRLKRVFGIEIEHCARCGGHLKVIASIEEPELIERILAHRRERGEEAAPTASLGARAAASFAVLISILLVDERVFSRTSGGRCCARRELRPYRRRRES